MESVEEFAQRVLNKQLLFEKVDLCAFAIGSAVVRDELVVIKTKGCRLIMGLYRRCEERENRPSWINLAHCVTYDEIEGERKVRDYKIDINIVQSFSYSRN